jgi:hypothetical protein
MNRQNAGTRGSAELYGVCLRLGVQMLVDDIDVNRLVGFVERSDESHPLL